MYLARILVANLLHQAADVARRAERIEDLEEAADQALRAAAAAREAVAVERKLVRIADRPEHVSAALARALAGVGGTR